jgi:hypothetical protein
MCPHCGREAPLLYRGPLAYCSACNQPRVPLSAAGVNLTGKPAKLGGKLAAGLGWVVIALMVGVAAIFGAVLQAIFPPGAVVGWVVGAVIAALGIGAGTLLLMGGRFLEKTGDKAAMNAQREALFALAENQKGIVRAGLASQALGVTPAEADVILTALSREPDSGTTLEVDGDGKLYYRFARFAPVAPWPEEKLRVEPAPAAPAAAPAPGVRVGSTGTAVMDELPAEDAIATQEMAAKRMLP